MSNIINTTPNEDGRIILELYGEKVEIDDSMFNDKGVAIIKKFGTDYEVHRPVIKTKKKKMTEAPTDVETENNEGEE